MKNIFTKYSLRTKLILLYTVLLIFSVVLVSYYSYWDIWQLLINNKTIHLRARAKPIIEHWLDGQKLINPDLTQLKFTPCNAVTLAHDLTSRNAVAVILNPKGKIVANGKRLPEEPVAPLPDIQYFRKAMSGINEISYLDKIHKNQVLVFLIPVRPQPGSGDIIGVIQVSTSLEDIDKIIFSHGSRQVTAVSVIIIFGILLGYWLTGINLKELQKLSEACQEIAKGNFTKRTDVRNREDEVGKLSDSFNLMTDKLEDLFNARKRFVADASHELLTPLTGLQGSLEVLLRGAQDDPESVNRLSKGMYKEVNHLIRLCDQLLGLSRLENSSNIRKERIVLKDFIAGFRQKAKHLISADSIIIQEGPPITLIADPDLLEQILFNLFSNAIRYSPSETPITLGWRLIPGYVEIYVADQGEGMNKEILSHAFKPFYRGKNKNLTKKRGSGLGLALTRSMVEAHGGSIRIKSTPDRGTTVFFTLPCNLS